MRVYLYKNSPIIVCVMAWITAGSVDPPIPIGPDVFEVFALLGVVGILLVPILAVGAPTFETRGGGWNWSDDIDDRRDGDAISS